MSKNKNNSVFKHAKRSFRKLKYLDKTQASYFVITTFIAVFCMFTGVTYSYFTFSKNMNAAVISIAKLNYKLESPTEGYNNQSIMVPAGETKFVDLDLRSLNSSRTKYALNYKSTSKDVNVYYSETLRKNMTGIIGAEGSLIDMRLVLENKGTEDAIITFIVKGGYTQNTLTSNITKGYFEEDLTIRPTIYDENFDNPTLVTNYPDKNEYSFYKAECSNGVTATFDTDSWELKRSDESKQTSCDVYFKKAKEEMEVYYRILGLNDTSSISKNKPDTSSLYRYKGSTCTNAPGYTFNETTFDFNISKYNKNALCVATFETDQELATNDRYNVLFDNAGGTSNVSSKTVIANGTYGTLPIPTKDGNIFEGWFTDGGEPVTSETIVNLTGNTKLYAHWLEANQVDVSLNRLGQNSQTLASTQDDYGISYYYPKDANNNYVKFAGLYWRILRINGDGSLRIIYDGKTAHENFEESDDRIIKKDIWNDAIDDSKYVGYMFEEQMEDENINKTNSKIKTSLEAWYKTNIVAKGYSKAVADKIFCNDRTSSNGISFGSYERLLAPEAAHVSLVTCSDKNDAFTVKDTTNGNAMLDYPVGLISADEANLIGALNTTDSYLYRGSSFWTMSPSRFDESAKMIIVSGTSTESSVNNEQGLVPVINLSHSYTAQMEGDGTIANPFKVR